MTALTEGTLRHMAVRESLLGRHTLGVLIVAAALLFMLPAAAFAFPPPIGDTEEPYSLFTCDQCHATSGESTAWDGSGPHKHYSTTTNKCVVCHDVHQAPAASVLLLRGPTVSQTCLMCHDGTGSGIGPYHSITSHGGTPVGDHSIEVTNLIPGGSDPLDDTLSCADCHSPHGSNTVTPFLRDSGRAYASDLYVTSDCLLRDDVKSGVPGDYNEYGAEWCASCHDERHSDAPLVNNHPVATDADWVYRNIVSTVSATSWRVIDLFAPDRAVGMGRTNGGFIMAPVAEAGDGRVEEPTLPEVRNAPICQQCHEDVRDVEATFSADYTFRGTDPWNSPINPAYVTFPHQTTSATLLAEVDDDLCLNCHSVGELP